jgi:hypothetical protein
VQNKAPPDAGARLARRAGRRACPCAKGARRAALWRYRGGPWDAAGRFPFAAHG